MRAEGRPRCGGAGVQAGPGCGGGRRWKRRCGRRRGGGAGVRWGCARPNPGCGRAVVRGGGAAPWGRVAMKSVCGAAVGFLPVSLPVHPGRLPRFTRPEHGLTSGVSRGPSGL